MELSVEEISESIPLEGKGKGIKGTDQKGSQGKYDLSEADSATEATNITTDEISVESSRLIAEEEELEEGKTTEEISDHDTVNSALTDVSKQMESTEEEEEEKEEEEEEEKEEEEGGDGEGEKKGEEENNNGEKIDDEANEDSKNENERGRKSKSSNNYGTPTATLFAQEIVTEKHRTLVPFVDCTLNIEENKGYKMLKAIRFEPLLHRNRIFQKERAIQLDRERGIIREAVVDVRHALDLLVGDLYEIQVLKENSSDRIPWDYGLRRGVRAYREEKYDEAVRCFSLMSDTVYGGCTYLLRALSNMRAHKFALGEECLTLSIEKIDGEDPYIFYLRGLCRSQLEKYDMAILDFSIAISLKSSEPLFHHSRGHIYRRKQNFRLARKDYETWRRLILAKSPTKCSKENVLSSKIHELLKRENTFYDQVGKPVIGASLSMFQLKARLQRKDEVTACIHSKPQERNLDDQMCGKFIEWCQFHSISLFDEFSTTNSQHLDAVRKILRAAHYMQADANSYIPTENDRYYTRFGKTITHQSNLSNDIFTNDNIEDHFMKNSAKKVRNSKTGIEKEMQHQKGGIINANTNTNDNSTSHPNKEDDLMITGNTKVALHDDIGMNNAPEQSKSSPILSSHSNDAADQKNRETLESIYYEVKESMSMKNSNKMDSKRDNATDKNKTQVADSTSNLSENELVYFVLSGKISTRESINFLNGCISEVHLRNPTYDLRHGKYDVAKRMLTTGSVVDGGRGWSQRFITQDNNINVMEKETKKEIQKETPEEGRTMPKIILGTVPRKPKQFNICEEKAELLVLPKSIYNIYLKPLLLSKYQHRVNALRSLPCFRGILNGEQYLELASQVEEIIIEEGQDVITQGETATDLYFIISGIGKVVKTLKYKDNVHESEDIKEKKMILGRLARNDVMGKRTLLGNVDMVELEALELASQKKMTKELTTSEDSKNSEKSDHNRNISEIGQNNNESGEDNFNEETVKKKEGARGVFVQAKHPFTVTAESRMIVYKLTYPQLESSSWNMQMVRKLQMMSIDEGSETRLLQKAIDLEVWSKLKKRVLTDY